MNVVQKPLEQKWKKHLELSNRKEPEFYENADDVKNTPHASAIRMTLRELGASAVFCVQDVPTIVLVSVDKYDREATAKLHASLWNQGLASLLLVLSGDTVRAFSLARIPYSGETQDFNNRYLVKKLNVITDALALKDIIYAAESGRFWEVHAEYFSSKERIDQVLLDNLTETYKLLRSTDLSVDAAQALLVQTMFIAYLEDREIIGREYFLNASYNLIDNFSALLESKKVDSLTRLFESLRNDFNGDLFFAPCSFDLQDSHTRLKPSHLNVLARFRSGKEVMKSSSGQYRFWGYDFKYIPIELISAVYDRFLGEKENKTERRAQGAYYTPMFLADTVISQVWDTLSSATMGKGHFLDPACGSGVFLVRLFQRLCENWRKTRKSQTLPWSSLLTILSRLHGWDMDSGAVRVAVFSLYIALLEEVSPPDIRLLIARGKVLPELWGQSLCHQDFFSARPEDAQVDVLIGNPPWSSRRGENRSSVSWCASERLPIPGKEDAWAFVWKSLRHLKKEGIVAFLLPAMAFLHNHANNAVAARNRFMRDARIFRIINFADLRFQLFEGAIRSAALIIFGHSTQEIPTYRFDYWAPKADLNLKAKRLITLSNTDKCFITSRMAVKDSTIFKQRIWMSNPEEKLFNYLSKFPTLGNLVSKYGALKRKRELSKSNWIIGQGFKPANVKRLSDPNYEREQSNIVANIPYLPISSFRTLFQTCDELTPWENGIVHRRGFEQGFTNPRILIPQGVDTVNQRLRASYLEAPVTFQHVLQALVFPHGEERRAKLLTTLLNSKLIIWFAFHGTGSFGSERPVVHQSELLRLPFPSTDDMPERKRSETAEKELVSLIDQMIESAGGLFSLQVNKKDTFKKLDCLTYEFFCLSDEEITLIDDIVEKIIPSIQPNRGRFPNIWKPANQSERQAYATTLVHSMAKWFEHDCAIGVRLEARNDDLAILRLTLNEKQNTKYIEKSDKSVGDALASLFEHIHQPLPGNFQLVPDFRIFIGNHLYLVKPTRKRFWLKSTALADADAIALDLQDAVFGNDRSLT